MMHENLIALLLQAHNWKDRNSFYKELNDRVKSLNEIIKILPTTKERDNKFFIEGVSEFLAKHIINNQ